MIDLERFSVFADSLEPDLDPELEKIREEAQQDGIPIIRREMQGFLRFLLHVSGPARILEIGSGTGFSALFMLRSMPDRDVLIDTVEHDPVNAEKARKNIRRMHAQERVRLIEADAAQALDALKGPYDFIFLDGPKGQYASYLPRLGELLDEGGILAADNVLTEGEIMESRYAVQRRQRTIHARMHDYLYQVTHSDMFVSSVISLGDGVCVSVKRSS